MELLSPAGNYESFIGAINAGADAVYLAGSAYGARAYADNFSDDEIIRAINYAHLFNKKVYLTVNTLVKEKEINDAVSFVKPFYLAGLDGVIIQDIGLIKIFSKVYPKLELHASTQCFITGVNAANYFKDLGCVRVVLARELGLDEIVAIKKETGLEVETFIHGSMCYSYSGDCLFSSCLGGRSGNRGRCAGPCRLSYDVYNATNAKEHKDGYFLSMKDQCTLNLIPKLVDAGIDSLKIEGRMKKPEYSAFVTSIYRKYIDLYNDKSKTFKVDSKDLDKLKSIYLRSQIQEGYYERLKGKEMISIDSPSYNGSDDALMGKIREKYLEDTKKIPVSMYFYISTGNKICLSINCRDKYVSIEGVEATKAQNAPISDETIKKSLSKLGDTFFCLESITIDNDMDSFVSVGLLNDLRRRACAELLNELLSDYTRSLNDINSFEEEKPSYESKEKCCIVNVTTKDQFNAVIKIIDSNFLLSVSSDLLNDIDIKAYDLNRTIIELPHVLRKHNIKKVSDIVTTYDVAYFICHNLEEVYLLKKLGPLSKIIAGPEIYDWNKEAATVISNTSKYSILPYELSGHEIKDVISDNSIINVYGRVPLMVSENCVQRTAFGCKKDGLCGFSHIVDRKNVDLPVYLSCNYCYNIIYNAIRTSLHEFIINGKLKSSNYILSFTNESYEETSDVLAFYKDVLDGKNARAPFMEYTKSYYNKGVE